MTVSEETFLDKKWFGFADHIEPPTFPGLSQYLTTKSMLFASAFPNDIAHHRAREYDGGSIERDLRQLTSSGGHIFSSHIHEYINPMIIGKLQRTPVDR